ncbi:hypothetical protein F4680DRAFT_186114 [Xylaria scruposa]|nr:hypothetical protein F4680DRAFT_186114 [Xylaria scruposa]
MQLLGSLIAILAATGIALPTANTPRQLGSALPVAGILSSVGKYLPPALGKLEGTLDGDKGKPTNGTKPAKKPDAGPLGPLSGLVGGL